MSKPSWGAWDRSPHLLGLLFCEAEESSTSLLQTCTFQEWPWEGGVGGPPHYR